jgi:hypothetical protein
MNFRVVFNFILAAVWAAAGVIFLVIAEQQAGERAEHFRWVAYMAFLMVLWNFLRAYLVFKKTKPTNDDER